MTMRTAALRRRLDKLEQNAESALDRDLPRGDVVVMEPRVGYDMTDGESGLIPFSLTKREDKESGGPVFMASIPARAIVWEAKTNARAVAAMLHGVAMLARDGALDPTDPARKGVPPIQHVLGILTERLAWHVEARRRGCEGEPGGEFNPDAHQPAPSDDATKLWLGRNSEVIAALGTAISALARIKDL